MDNPNLSDEDEKLIEVPPTPGAPTHGSPSTSMTHPNAPTHASTNQSLKKEISRKLDILTQLQQSQIEDFAKTAPDRIEEEIKATATNFQAVEQQILQEERERNKKGVVIKDPAAYASLWGKIPNVSSGIDNRGIQNKKGTQINNLYKINIRS